MLEHLFIKIGNKNLDRLKINMRINFNIKIQLMIIITKEGNEEN